MNKKKSIVIIVTIQGAPAKGLTLVAVKY